MRKDLKYALKAGRRAKENHKEDQIASALQEHSPRNFWQNIKKRNKKSKLPYALGDTTGETFAVMGKKTSKNTDFINKKNRLLSKSNLKYLENFKECVQ